MSEEAKTPEEIQAKLINPKNPPRVTRATTHRTLYVDTTKLGYSPWDIRLTFGLLTEEELGVSVNQEQITIILAPSHAKTLMRILNEQIPIWESTFGEILDPLAPENQQALEEKQKALIEKDNT